MNEVRRRQIEALRGWPLATLLVTLLWAPAQAQPQVLDSTGKRAPSTRAEILFAAKVTKAASLPLERASRLVQPAGEPQPLAGQKLRGQGEQVELAGLSVIRVAFGTAQQAKLAAALMGRGARVDPDEPRYVTQVTGPKTSPEILTQIESLATGATLPEDLAKSLLASETSRNDYACELEVPRPSLGFTGVEVNLRGLSVFRLRFDSERDARVFLERKISEIASRGVMHRRGQELVLLAGPKLSELALARKALKAAWKAGAPPKGKAGAIGVWGKRGPERERTFAVYSTAEGTLYQAAAGLLRGCRKEASGTTKSLGLEWRFSDPKTRNHVLFQVRARGLGGESTLTRAGGVLLTPEGALHVSARTQDESTQERRYLLELMNAVGQKPPARSTERVRLPEPR
ncbi:MAG: hypothetical protein JKY65_11920 [Planctomycetes bacterium]|nr:hypothetical protein [Planctomycetota bacterium]